MRNQGNGNGNGIGEYSTSPAGQGCLWIAAIGVLGVLGFAYLGSYTGAPQDPLDHMENGIAGVSRPTGYEREAAPRSYRRRVRRHYSDETSE